MSRVGIAGWLRENRGSVRLAYAMQLGSRIATSLASLVWIPLLIDAMGKVLNGNYIAFQRLISLGGLGDLGMGGAVAIRAGRQIGEGKYDDLRTFLSSARSLFLLLALAACGVLLLLSPWPHLLRFDESPGSGSFHMLFVVGAVMVAGTILSSYMTSVNYACGNIIWPIVPSFILLQLGFCGHWLLARQHEPLWIQFLPYAGASICGLWLMRTYVRASHPPLAEIFPLRLDWRMAATLFESTFWVYLCSLGNAIYRSTDALVINAGFAGALTDYDNNYKACDIMVFVVLSASYVSMPRITQWMASANANDRARVNVETQRLNQFQTLLGCAGALAYLAGNDLFIRTWMTLTHSENPVVPAPLILQTAFALNMAVTAGGDAGIQMAGRTGSKGLRFAGSAVGLTGLLNLGLSIWAMKAGLLWGIAMATVVAQSLLSLASTYYVSRHLGMNWTRWAIRGWLVPVAAIVGAAFLRYEFPVTSAQNILLLSVIYGAMLIAMALSLGITPATVREEMKIFRSFLPKK